MKKIIFLIVFLSLIVIPVFIFAKNNTPVDLVCVQSAVNKRDGAIITAWDKYSASVKSALDTRKSALNSAWTISDKTQRKQAIKAAWKTYKDGIKSIRKTWTSERKTAWKTWKTDIKACNGNAGADDGMTESVDNNL